MMTHTTEQTLPPFSEPELFETEAGHLRVRVDSVAERIYDDREDRIERPVGSAALKLSLFREQALFELASYGPMH